MYLDCDAPNLFDQNVAHRAVHFQVADYTSDVASMAGVALPPTMSKAVAKRKAEYIAGRLCAMRAFEAQTGRAGLTIPTGTKGEPVWPDGWVGSITHTRGFAAAVVADSQKIRGLGIDSEEIMTTKVMENVAPRICRAEEPYRPDGSMPRELYTTLIFSAKESLFKCLHPLVGKMFWFEDARIEIADDLSGTFYAELLTTLSEEFCAGLRLTGRFQVDAGLVHTGISLPGVAMSHDNSL
jgi:enterobactin synthetase component D